MLKWLEGKKTYLVAVATFILGGVHACGVVIPAWLYTMLAATGLGALRTGVKKTGADTGP